MLTSSFRRILLPAVAVVPWVVLAYSGTFGLSFASEDFILLGRLAKSSVFEILATEAAGPWLGLEHVNFYRPVAMALLAGETRLFGLSPFAFHLAHVLLHCANALLVFWIVRLLVEGQGRYDASGRPDDRRSRANPGTRWLPLAVALLFALYPLHPSAVLFVGSFATLWGGTFQLLALGCFLSFVQSGQKSWGVVGLGAFVLALGSYEAAAVLPAVMVLGGFALKTPGSRRRSVLGALPFAGILVVYLLVRKAALGVVLGGYPSFRSRWLEKAGQLMEDLLTSLPRLVLPDMDRAPSQSLLVAVSVVALVTIVGASSFLRGRGFQPRLVLLGLAWAVIFQLPFSFVGVVPANGRFWYLPSFAIALAVGMASFQLWNQVWRREPRWLQGAWLLPVLFLMLVYGLLLRRDLEAYRAADQQVRGIQQAVQDGGDSAPWLLAGIPDFTTNGRGLPVAKVFQFGLHDAALAPFLPTGKEVLPVPAFVSRDRLLPLAAALDGRGLVWNQKSFRLHPPRRVGAPEEAIVAGRQAMRVLYTCPDCNNVRFFAVTRGGAFRGEPTLATAESLALPQAFLRGMGGLYGGPILWWLEGEKAGSGERVVSAIHRLETADLFPDLVLRFGGGPAR